MVFNLPPAFPLDGGQLLRAWRWQRTGDLLGATRLVVRVGFVVAFAALAGGVVLLAGGALALGWIVAVTGAQMLLLVNAQSRAPVGRIPTRPATVADLRQGPVIAQEHLPVGEFLDQLGYERGYSTSPIPVEREGRLVGVMSMGLAHEVAEEDRARVTVGDAMLRKEDAVILDAGTPIAEALSRLEDDSSGRGVVLEQGEVTGIVLRSVVAQTLLEAADAQRGKVAPERMAW